MNDPTMLDSRTVENLAQRIGVAPNHIRGYLRGAKTPAPWVAEEIARTLGRPVYELFPRVERATRLPSDLHRRSGR